ncbi:MAG: tetratricopeptide repeat protein [Acidobacteriota bacterium]|nr:tetratricopeptide repeat protein [Acidobacteriota bacterium]
MKRIFAVVVIAVIAALTWWVATTPDHALLRRWRARQDDLTAEVIIGPYPIESDFRKLQRQRVKLIVCLLNPQLPYERVLLERERTNASRAGIELRNFPMTSLWGTEVGDQSRRNSKLAAEAAKNAKGRVYLHCYLGIHRAREVADMITGSTSVTRFEPRAVERSADRRLLDAADAAYARGDYAAALQSLSKIEKPDAAAHALRGWASYKSGGIDRADEAFRAASFAAPRDAGPLVGLGYVALRRNDLTAAQESFRRALLLRPDDVDALTGAGIAALRQNRRDDAVPLLERAVALAPENQEAIDALKRARGPG